MKRINLDKSWRFMRGDLKPQSTTDGWGGAKARAYSFGAAAVGLDDSHWQNVDLPHDFMIDGDYTQKSALSEEMRQIPEMESIDSRHFAGGSLEGGVAWYRRKFDIPADMAGKRVYIHFDGVYRNSTVYLNEYFAGSHESGYTEACYDITDFVNFGGENTVAVRVDSSGREGWWYEGGGIYRHVWLEYKSAAHIAENGVYAYSDVCLENNSANVHIETEIENKLTENADFSVKIRIADSGGAIVGSSECAVSARAWDNAVCEQTVPLSSVSLWDVDSPYLYSVTAELYRIADSFCGELIDSVTVNFGIRECHFDADKGFFLNGRHLTIKGLCCHQDHAGVGIGVPDSVWEYRIAQMKTMGANAYRSAHYPPSPQFLDVCDRLGILVMDETRRMSSAPQDLDALRSMVKRDRNHPSVFIWGTGNEEIFSQDRPETARTTVTMKMEVRRLDKTRPITSAVVCWNGKERFDTAKGYVGVTKNLDVMGFNYCKTAWDDYHRRMPRQPILITEASANSWTRGCCSTDEHKGQYYIFDEENEQKCKVGKKAVKRDVAEDEWEYFAERDYLSGIFLWTGMDYRGEPTPMVYPAVYSQFGIFDYCGFPKDNYYYYKSQWTDEDILHIFPHWNYPVGAGEALTVYAFSNLDEAELFVNGKSYGRRKSSRYLSWGNVIYEPGELTAVGYRNGGEVMRETVKTTGAVHRLSLEPYKAVMSADEDTAIINIFARDADGLTVPTADNEVRFYISGEGEFLGAGNGNPSSRERDRVPVRRLFNGKAQLLVRLSGGRGEVKITAVADGIESGECVITAE
ncbi:MAG: DUF4982 domain-containing protein [Oscillospiraceae bacterium]|nr:DUF4982 domain-containing protein [Oscillospiraceae bacterium]